MSEIKLYKGDCLIEMNNIQDNTVDLTVTSPPYDNLRTYGGAIDGWSFKKFQEIAKQLYRITKDGRIVVWIVGDSTIKGSETGTSFKQALYFMELGFKLHDTMIWNKGSFAFPSQNRYHQVFEYMFIFSKGDSAIFNPIKDRRNMYIGIRGASGRKSNGERNIGKSMVTEEFGKRFNVWDYPIGGGHSASDKIAFKHPAIFPENLAKDHIISWSNEGDTILDCFMGSGTTGKMAILNNRNFIGIELNEEYFDIADKRIKEAQRQLTLF